MTNAKTRAAASNRMAFFLPVPAFIRTLFLLRNIWLPRGGSTTLQLPFPYPFASPVVAICRSIGAKPQWSERVMKKLKKQFPSE